MEAFPHVVDKLLREFSILLTHSPPPIHSTRLIQLMAINMYAAHHTQRQGKDREPTLFAALCCQQQIVHKLTFQAAEFSADCIIRLFYFRSWAGKTYVHLAPEHVCKARHEITSS